MRLMNYLSYVGVIVIILSSCSNRITIQDLKGPYLGQKPPGMTPEVFAPGFISTDKNELCAVFSPEGDEFYYAIHVHEPKDQYMIMFTKQVDGVWTNPQIAPFSGEYTDVDMAFSPDGSRLYFCSKRPVPDNPSPDYNIWFCERLHNNQWSEPELLGPPINSSTSETYPTFTQDGTMYFSSSREGGHGSKDVYYSKFENGAYQPAVNLGEAINSQYGEGDTYVAPDESYMIVKCWGRPEGKGLDISFKQEDGTWTRRINMEKILKRNIVGGCPYVSPDGKYLFFTRDGDIYWVDASVIEELRFQKNVQRKK